MLVSTTLERSFNAMASVPGPAGDHAPAAAGGPRASPAACQAGARVSSGDVVEEAVVADHRPPLGTPQPRAAQAAAQAESRRLDLPEAIAAVIVLDPVVAPGAARERGPAPPARKARVHAP